MDASSGSTNPGKQEASDEDVSPQDFVEQRSDSPPKLKSSKFSKPSSSRLQELLKQ
jgi:hypothetical protein